MNRVIKRELPNIDYLANEVIFSIDIIECNTQTSVLPGIVEEKVIFTVSEKKRVILIPIKSSVKHSRLQFSIYIQSNKYSSLARVFSLE